MDKTARQTLHVLVDELPEERLEKAIHVLQRVKRSNNNNEQREIDIINAHADELNAEMEDVLGYQAD